VTALGLLLPGDPHGPEERASIAARAETSALDALWIGPPRPGHEVPGAPILLLAWLAARTARLRIGAFVPPGLLPDPVRLAEDHATVERLSGGRAELALQASGSGVAGAATADGADDAGRLHEQLSLLLRLGREEEVHWRGRIRPPLEGVTVHPRPPRRPQAAVWLCGGDPAAAELAAEAGVGLLLPPGRDAEAAASVVERYRTAWAAGPHPAEACRVGAWSRLAAVTTAAEPPAPAAEVLTGPPAALAERLGRGDEALGLALRLLEPAPGAEAGFAAVRAFLDDVLPILRQGRAPPLRPEGSAGPGEGDG